MLDGYYEPHPRVALDRPLLLVGHPGSGVAQVGRAICGLTGLPFNDVERKAEAQSGASRSKILIEQGLGHLRELEASALRKSLRRRPAGIVVAESALFEDAAMVEWLRERAAAVYLRRPYEVLLRRIQRQLQRGAGSIPEFLVAEPRRIEDLETLYAQREASLRGFEIVLEVGDEHPIRIASQLLASLDRLTGIERID